MTTVVHCHSCGREHHFADIVPFRAECEGCAADLHACVGCRFYDRYVENECREDAAEFVAVKDRRNLCEYWKPKAGATGDDEAAKAKAKLAALFGGGPAPAAPTTGSASTSTDPAEEAKRKLAALFKKQ